MSKYERLTLGLPVLALTALACNGSRPRLLAPPGAIPPSTSVAGTTMTFGFALGVPRTQLSVASFSITKEPITVGDYQKCIAAGACSPPALAIGACSSALGSDGQTYSDDASAANLVLTCATPEQVTDYCGWVGGRPPRAAEWVLAARGSQVQRFSWGNADPTCDLRSRVSFLADFPNPCCGEACSSIAVARVGQHSAAVSPSGLADVLLTRSEFLGPDASPGGLGCAPGSPGCIVASLAPGAIDGIGPVPDGSNAYASPFAFRCVWDGGGQ